MGIVRKQSIYSVVFIFVGFFIGALNTLILYATFLTKTEYGLTRVFQDFYSLFAVLASLGSITAFYKFYPLYNAKLGKKYNDLPFLAILACFTGCVLLIIGSVIFKDLIVRKYSTNSPLFVKHFYLVYPLTISMILMNLLEGFAFMLKRTIALNLIKEIGFRLAQTIIIILFALRWISFDTFLILFSLMYVPSILLLGWVVFAKDGIVINFNISRLTRKIYKKVTAFAAFHFSGSVIAILPTTVNGMMIAAISKNGLADAAIYTIARFLISTLEVPLRGMRGIGIATISEALHHNDKEKVFRMYQKTSLNLLIIGIGLFGIIYPNISNIIALGKSFEPQPIILIFSIAGIAKVLELSMGMNDSILSLSKYWKIEFYITTSVIILSIPVNYFLIKNSPLMGAAIADALMLTLFCLLRFTAVYKLFQMQPYTLKTLVVILLGVCSIFFAIILPKFFPPIPDAIIRSGIFLILYGALILIFRVSDDITDLYKIAIQKLK